MIELTTEQTSAMSAEEQEKLLHGFYFILGRAKKIASYHRTMFNGRDYGKTFDPEAYHIEILDKCIRISWMYNSSTYYREEESDYCDIPFSAVFSMTEEEKLLQEKEENRKRIEAEARERARIEREAAETRRKAQIVISEKEMLKALLAKYGAPE